MENNEKETVRLDKESIRAVAREVWALAWNDLVSSAGRGVIVVARQVFITAALLGTLWLISKGFISP